MNHRGPLPLRELHSTGETIVWRDPGGSWACLQPVYDWEWSHSATGCDTDRQVAYIFVKQVVFLTVNHRGPLPLRELHSTGEKLVWRDPGGSWACLRPVYDWEWSHCHRLRHWQSSGVRLCKAGRFSYGESPRTPPLEGTSLHRRKISVERPWGILSLFTTCLRLRVKSPCHSLWHIPWTMPWEAHWEERNPATNNKC